MTPTQRTLAANRELGREVGIVERFVAFAGPHGTRIDLFGFIDIVAIDPQAGIVAIQSCGQAYSEHVHKMADERTEIVKKWLKWAPLELWGWRKVKAVRGGKAMRWKPRIADAKVDESGAVVFVEREPKPQM
jgi:hypothetical protein